MKKFYALVGLLLAVALPAKAEVARVINVQPKYVTYTEEQCRYVYVEKPATSENSAGGVLGAIAGAAIGNQIGGGSGKDIATVVGGVLGYQAGKGDSQPGGVEQRRVCEAVPVRVRQGEIVTFRYKGITFTHTFD